MDGCQQSDCVLLGGEVRFSEIKMIKFNLVVRSKSQNLYMDGSYVFHCGFN